VTDRSDQLSAVFMDDRVLLADFRHQVVRLALLASWGVLAALILYAIRNELFGNPNVWGAAAGATLGLAALLGTPWRDVLVRPAGDLILLLWCALTIVLLSLVSTESALAGSAFFFYFAVVAFSAAWFPPLLHGLVSLVALAGRVIASVIAHQAITLEGLALEVLALGVVAGVTGMVSEKFRQQARKGYRQVEELRHREADLERLYELSRTVAAGESLTEVLPELVGRIARYLKARVGVVLLYRAQQHALEVVSPLWMDGHPLKAEDYSLPLARGGTVERVFMQNTPILSNSLSDDPDLQDTLLDDLRIEQAMVVPLRVENRTMGVLLVADREGGFTQADLEALQSLSAPAALVLDQLARYEQVEETGKRMEELAALKTHFVSVVSHELRSPLTSIIGSLATLARPELAPAGPAAQELLTSARKQAERLRAMIEDLLMVSRIDAHALPQTPERLDLNEFIVETVEGIPGWQGRVTVSTDLDFPIEADPEHLRRIMSNLVGNALKYAGDSPVEVITRRAGEEIWVSIIDHGPGIPEKDRERAFERFIQLQRPHTRPGGGTGLGLSIVRNLAEAMGGRVWLEETPGGGATFTLALPRSPGAVRRVAAS
jgi:signal transduction histidine kinase